LILFGFLPPENTSLTVDEKQPIFCVDNK